MTQAELAEARAWRESHKRPELSWREKQARAKEYWEKQSVELARLRELRPDAREIPSVTAYEPQRPIDPLGHLDFEERQAYLVREEIARRETVEKMKKVAPLYNKGGLQYLGDDPQLIGSVATGTNRRRS